MKVGIVGLGLIGGSMAKAFNEAGNEVFAFDTDKSVLGIARLSDTVKGELNEKTIPSCELIIIALYPAACVKWLEDNAKLISQKTLVIDCAGVKRVVCEPCFNIAKKHGFTFVGGHPMAGTQFSGYKHSRANLFSGASMIVVPPKGYDINLLDRVKTALSPAGFAKLTVTSDEEHDAMIAFTSQLAHVVSSAYAKSPTALRHKGFSAGSYKDMTRVARLNEDMWTELFLENADKLGDEIGRLITELSAYKKAIDSGDEKTLHELLAEGRRCKEAAEK